MNADGIDRGVPVHVEELLGSHEAVVVGRVLNPRDRRPGLGDGLVLEIVGAEAAKLTGTSAELDRSVPTVRPDYRLAGSVEEAFRHDTSGLPGELDPRGARRQIGDQVAVRVEVLTNGDAASIIDRLSNRVVALRVRERSTAPRPVRAHHRRPAVLDPLLVVPS